MQSKANVQQVVGPMAARNIRKRGIQQGTPEWRFEYQKEVNRLTAVANQIEAEKTVRQRATSLHGRVMTALEAPRRASELPAMFSRIVDLTRGTSAAPMAIRMRELWPKASDWNGNQVSRRAAERQLLADAKELGRVLSLPPVASGGGRAA